MGVDIYAYQLGEYKGLLDYGQRDALYDQGIEYVAAFPDENFPLHAAPLVLEESADGESWSTWIAADRYTGPSYSYHGYNIFRALLSETVTGNPPHHWWDASDLSARYADVPFLWLINFADNEGTIGPNACKKLAADFTEHQATIDTTDRSDDFRETYAAMRAVFDWAAKRDGIVQYR